MRYLLLTLSVLCTFNLKAQTLKGKLIDENKQPFPYANIVLLSLPDSAFVSGTMSGEDGGFSLDATGKNQVLQISSIGYKTLYKSVNTSDLGIIQLVPDMQQLGEVVVKADLPKTRVKGNAVVTTVAGSVLEKAGTGNDLLGKIPGVSASDGSVNVFGSGAAEIYVNGRKMRNSSELDQLSSDNIKSVEVLRNPGARYDASVKAVVRIITKKPQGEGFGFSNRAYAGYRYDRWLGDQFNFNYRKGGFDLGGMLFGVDSKYEDNKTLLQRTYLDKLWEQSSDAKSRYHTRTVAAMLSMNYLFNENHALGVRYDFDRNPMIEQQLDLNLAVHRDRQVVEEGYSKYHSNRKSNQHLLNMYYNGKVADWSFDFNADGMWSDSKKPDYTEESIKREDGTEDNRQVNTFARRDNKLYAAKLVAEHPLWDGNVSIGTEYTYSNRDNLYTNVEGIVADNDNNIEENAVSAFLEYARSFGKLRGQVGVRYEHLNSGYYEYGRRVEEQSRIYDNVFPSFALSYPVGKVQLMLSYTGNIERPSYSNLSNSIAYINRYTYEGGNPLLRPAITNTLTFNTAWKWLYFTMNYMHIDDLQVKVSKAYSENDPSISYMTYANAPDADKLNLMLSLSPTIGIWSPQFSVMYSQQWLMVDVPEGRRNMNNPMGMFRWNNTFDLPKGFQVSLDMMAATRGETETVRILKPRGSVDVSIYKGFMNDCLTFQLQASDLFNTSATDIVMYSGNRTVSAYPEVRRSFSLTVRYKFNATKSKYKGSGAGTSQRERM